MADIASLLCIIASLVLTLAFARMA